MADNNPHYFQAPGINRTITLILSLFTSSFLFLIFAAYFQHLGIVLTGAGVILAVGGIYTCFALKKMIHFYLSGQLTQIDSLIATVEAGKADLSDSQTQVTHPGAVQIQQKYNGFLGSVRELIDSIRRIGVKLAMDATAVADTISRTQQETGEQKKLSDTVFNASSDANHAISQISESTRLVSGKTTENLEMANRSFQELEDVSQKISQINDTVQSFANTVADLKRSSSEIRDIVDTISEISDQTSLLSLNATIEAARAAEHGKGFAVVAEEVRHLSQRIKPATETINHHIQAMVDIVEQTRQATALILDYSENTRKVVNTATGNFKSLMHDFKDSEAQLTQVAESIEELSATNSEITLKTQDIHSLSQTIASDMDRSGSSMSDLNQATEKMLEMVSMFKTGDGPFDCLIETAHRLKETYELHILKIHQQGINVFDSDKREVPDTSPQKYTTEFSNEFIKTMIPVYDWGRSQIPGAIYALAIDRDGYLPAHHEEFSQPLTGDPETDLLNSRHQRIFLGNATEQRRCTHTMPMLMQTYMRDTGQILNDLSLPIFINNRHWGALIIGFDPSTIFSEGAAVS